MAFCKDLWNWLHRIQRQLRRDYPPHPVREGQPKLPAVTTTSSGQPDAGDPDAPPQQQLPSKPALLAFVGALRAKADAAVRADEEAHGHVTRQTAILSLHALLTEYMSGLFTPPLRLSCIRTLVPVGFTGEACDGGSCRDVDCRRRGCPGNALRLSVPSGPSTSLAPPSLVVELWHHKTARFVREPITFSLPAELATSTTVYLEKARPVLAPIVEVEPPFLFLTPNGSAFGENAVGMMWRSIQVEHAAPWQPFAARQFRHIHATGEFNALVREVEAARGRLEGDAHVMGNSARVWDAHYVKGRGAALAQAAVRRLTTWREGQRKLPVGSPGTAAAATASVPPASPAVVTARVPVMGVQPESHTVVMTASGHVSSGGMDLCDDGGGHGSPICILESSSADESDDMDGHSTSSASGDMGCGAAGGVEDGWALGESSCSGSGLQESSMEAEDSLGGDSSDGCMMEPEFYEQGTSEGFGTEFPSDDISQ